MFSIEMFKHVGAKVLLTVFVVPVLLLVGSAAATNKEEINANKTDIAVIKSSHKNDIGSMIRQLDRIETNISTIRQHLLGD